jgi:hypothetical protein
VRKRHLRALAVPAMAALVLALAPHAGAYHYYAEGWRDKHVYYPTLPSGYSQIVSVFGQPCNSNSTANAMNWRAADDGVTYIVRYHYKLGGYGTKHGGTGSLTRSSNLNHDIRGHITNAHLNPKVRRGIWGYNCRYISGTTKWSTHAWGIAVDINSAYESTTDTTCTNEVNAVAPHWKNHRWIHGASFRDCMHFQYATNY